MAWIEYPIKTQTGNYVNGRYDPATGAIQVKQDYSAKGGDNWIDIGSAQQNAQSAQYSDPYGNITYPGMLPSVEQLWQMRLAQQQQAQQQATQGDATSQGSYYGAAMSPQITMGGTSYPSGAAGSSGATTGATSGSASGGGGGAANMATTSASNFPLAMFGSSAAASDPNNIREWQKWYGANVGKTILVNGQPTTLTAGNAGDIFNAFQSNKVGWGQASGAQTPAPTNATDTQQPEQRALQQMQQIDPATEALRQQLSQSYSGALSQAQTGPNASQLQSYLDLYKQIDPQTYAAMQAMGPQYQNLIAQQQGATGQVAGNLPQYAQQIARAQSYLPQYEQDVQRMSDLAALGTQLDPATIREITQQTRLGQQARGNVYGTPQLVQEAMQRGQSGMAIQQQREQMLQAALQAQQGGLSGVNTALGAQQNAYNQYLSSLQNQQGGLGAYQSYLSSGATPGAVALGLYNQQLGNLRSAQNQALSYMGSGQTPYQAGASYLSNAQQQASNAAQSSYQYQPSSLGQNYLSNQQQQYGLDIGSQAQNYFNSLQNAYGYGGGGTSKNQTGAALGGALSGAASGAATGTAIYPGIGTAVGAIGGAVLGGAGGYFS